MATQHNPFPTDEDVRFMTQMQARVQEALVAGSGLSSAELEAEVRKSSLAVCLSMARKANHWSQKACAQWIGTPAQMVSLLEHGRFDQSTNGHLERYVKLLSLEELYRQWLEANHELAQSLGLQAYQEQSRPEEWPQAKSFELPPGLFRIGAEKRALIENAFEIALEETGAKKEFGERAEPAVYQLKISLRGIKPPIWRRVQVSNEITLGQLHDVIQIVMGWGNEHLHGFTIKDDQFAPTTDPMGGPLELGLAGMNELDEDEYQLRELGLRARAKFRYTYDFGDSWEHEIVLEKVLPLEAKFIPTCIKGERAGPPEDSGGVWGYAEKLEALADREHPEHEEAVDWMGAKFNPEKFDINSVNQQLRKLAKFWKSADAGRG